MLVRPMLPEDAAIVAMIHTLAWQHAYSGIIDQGFLDAIDLQKRSEGWRNGIIKNDPAILRLVAVMDEKICGFLTGLENRKADLLPHCDSELWAIYVHPAQLRNGAGKKLFARFNAELRAFGKKRFCVWALEENTPARKFYESQGGILSSVKKDIVIGEQTLIEVAYEFSI